MTNLMVGVHEGQPVYIKESTNQTSNKPIEPTVLEKAQQLIYGERNKTYRHPSENFENIANLWNAYFQSIQPREDVFDGMQKQEPEFKINKHDVAYMMILMKVARGATNQEHEDTIIDIAGYAGCLERIIKNK